MSAIIGGPDDDPLWTDREYDLTFTPGQDLTGYDVEWYIVEGDKTRHQVGTTQSGTDQSKITGFTIRASDESFGAGRYTLLTVTVDGDGNEETLEQREIEFTKPKDD